jgi:hypothetical protein
MSTVNDLLVLGLVNTQALLKRYVADFSPKEYLHRPSPNANCAAWTVGHLAMTDRHLLKLFGAALPEISAGFDKRFSRDEGCPQAEDFGDVSTVVPVFDQHRDRLTTVAKSASPEQLNKKMDKPIGFATTFGDVLVFASIHTSMHAGQIVMIRRSLGRPPLF